MNTWSLPTYKYCLRFCIDLISIEFESRYCEIDSWRNVSFLSDNHACLITHISDDIHIDSPHLGDTVERLGCWYIDPIDRSEYDTIQSDKSSLRLECLGRRSLIVDSDSSTSIGRWVRIDCLELEPHRIGSWGIHLPEWECIASCQRGTGQSLCIDDIGGCRADRDLRSDRDDRLGYSKMKNKQKQSHRHDESDGNQDKMRSIFFHMNDFFLGICLLEYEKVEILHSSSHLIPEILEHRHIVCSNILSSILSVELSMYTYHLRLDTKGTRDQCWWSISEYETIYITRKTSSQHEKKVSREREGHLWEINHQKSWIRSVFSRDFFECCHLWHITRDVEGIIIHIDRVHNA